MKERMKMPKIKTENMPVIIIAVVLTLIVVVSFVSPYVETHSRKSDSYNYQVRGEIDTSNFMIERAYLKNDNLVVESLVEKSDTESIDTQSVYYKLGFVGSEDVISQGFLTDKIEVKLEDGLKENIQINLYGVKSISEVESAVANYQVVIDKEDILEYVNVVQMFKNYDTLSIEKKQEFSKYLSMNYLNKSLKTTYSNGVYSIFKDYIKEKNDDEKIIILDDIMKVLLEKYNYYCDIAKLVDEDFDSLIENSLAIDSNYYKSKAIKTSIDYLEDSILTKIEAMERELTDRSVDLTEYNELKNTYPLKDRYEYLEKLLADNPKKKEDKDKEETKDKSNDEAKEEPVVEEPVIEEPVIEESVIEESVVEEPVIEEPVAQEPVIEEPAVEEPVIEEPTVEQPSTPESEVQDDLCYPTNGDANNEAVNQMINDSTIAGFEIDGNNCITYKYY